ncbi:HutD/Ves family protein [Variovorax sp. LT1P1]|uniref:HutD/Ves family protein n=1 Tax=Variovorax sp. LT1P1 TaxID=3443730 RepID=UPI003F44C3D3
MAPQRFSLSALAAAHCKSGSITSQEIVRFPPSAGLDSFDWQVGIATISLEGPFPVVSGADHTVMLLDGEGVRLRAPGFDQLLDTPHMPLCFDGDTAMTCSMLGGRSIHLNLMVRRAGGRGTLRVLSDPATLERSAHGLLMTLDGHFRVGGGTLKRGEGVWWTEEPHSWKIKPASRGARLVMVQWHPADQASAPEGSMAELKPIIPSQVMPGK